MIPRKSDPVLRYSFAAILVLVVLAVALTVWLS